MIVTIFTKYNNIFSPYIIAEIGSNYNQDINLAYKLIKLAQTAKLMQ